MKNKESYLILWKKYLPAIRILLKKSSEAEQTLKLYKHEIHRPGVAASHHIFDLRVINGKPELGSNSKAAANDLLIVLNENESVSEWLKENNVSISLNAAFLMKIVKL